MSRVRDLPEIFTLEDDDLFYVVDSSAGPNGGRKIRRSSIGQNIVHEDLTGLSADDHTQYLLVAGTRAMTGSLDMGGNAIGNVGLVDGVDISDHSARHEVGGTDALTTAAPTTNLTPTSTNAQGSPTAYSPNTHTHAFSMGQTGDISTINAGDTEILGSTNRFAEAGHQHPVSTATAVSLTPNIGNAEGNSTALARANHTHDVPVGTPVSTGTANATGSAATFVRSDHVHKTVIQNAYASQTVADTTLSLTDVLMVGMTLPSASLPAGDYFVDFNSSMVNSGNGAERNYASIYVGGVQVAASEVRVGIAGGAVVPVSIGAKVTVNGSQNIEIFWRVIGGTGTVYQRTLRAMQVA